MKKMLIVLKNRLLNFGKWWKIIFVTFCVCAIFAVAGMLHYKNYMAEQEAKKDEIYILKSAQGLFQLRGEALDKVSKLYIISKSYSSDKDIVIKYKDNPKIYIYKTIRWETFNSYNQAILQPYLTTLGKNRDLDLRFAQSYKGIESALDVPKAPSELVSDISLLRDNQGSKDSSGFLFNLIFIGLMLYLFFFFNRKSTNAINKVLPKDIQDSLDDLEGLADIKQELLQLEDMVINRELYKKHNISRKLNVMLTGPAGVGKTKIARCLAKRLHVPMFYSSASSLESGYVGGGSRALKKLMKEASRYRRAIIFLDEAENLLQNRTNGEIKSWERDTNNTLLSLLDGVDSNDSEIIWIVASNMDEHKVQMDDAMLRRFQLKINFRLPNYEERKAILTRLVAKMAPETLEADIDLTKLAGISSGLSPAILETTVNRAGLIAIKEKSKVSQNILLKAFERVSVGLTDRATTENMDEQRLIIARHEAGHFILKVHQALKKCGGKLPEISNHIDVIKISTESVSKLGALGFVLSREPEVKLHSLEDYEMEIMQLYGGMVNEEIFYKAVGVTAGAHNDIEKVSHLLRVMIGEVGFYQKHKLNYSLILKSGDLSQEQVSLIEKTSERLYSTTFEILNKHKRLTSALVNRLMSDYVLEIDDALSLVTEYFNSDTQLLLPYRQMSQLCESSLNLQAV